MKKRKLLSVVLSTLVTFSILSTASVVTANAATNVKVRALSNCYDSDSYIASMQKQVHKNKSNVKVVSLSSQYIKYQYKKDSAHPGKIISKAIVSNQQEYLKENSAEMSKNVQANDIQRSDIYPGHNTRDSGDAYSWIKLTLEVDYTSPGNYDVYGFFDWLKSPYYYQTDFIAIQQDSKLAFTHGSGEAYVYMDSFQPSINNNFYDCGVYPVTNHIVSGQPGSTDQIYGVGTRFDLEKMVTGPYAMDPHCYGVEHVKAIRDTSDPLAELAVGYEHEEENLAIDPQLTITPAGGDLKVTVTGKAHYDSATVAGSVDLSYGAQI
ncbi:hypothetical protein IAI10_13860 [Clostridium sp. 19966]|uniref:hypothetical protein n=1 Tax=Clostridium sp. 19966 TaxID=2768166 RepID=UPI0028DF2E4D|nr:hypothetical protein [Clostridium sp. 19966]MDT8717750.1 hypothetical protein [Clostridium sp. 19966]